MTRPAVGGLSSSMLVGILVMAWLPSAEQEAGNVVWRDGTAGNVSWLSGLWDSGGQRSGIENRVR
ncbi:MAG: hypothetical protein ABSF26_19445 [Thermoguttaceae bacterium]|jgi:hypothetical protein